MKLTLILVASFLLFLAQSRLIRPDDHRLFTSKLNTFNGTTPPLCHEGAIAGYEQKIYSGYLPVGNDKDSYLFFAFYYALNATADSTTPVTIWLNGGPGCSSMEGNFKEMGPYKLVYIETYEDWDQVQRPMGATWNANSHMLFIDQPVGTGYSLLGSEDEMANSSMEAADDFYNALQAFYNISESPCGFNNLKENPLFLFGESFAGHYIPAIATKILSENKNPSSGSIVIPLKAIGIGDGLTDSPEQTTSYGLYSYNLALIDESDRMNVDYIAQKSYFLSQQGQLEESLNYWNQIFRIIGEADGNMNVYNIYVEGDYDDSNLSDFCNSETAFLQFGLVDGTEWTLCNYAVYNRFSNDFMKSYASEVAQVLKEIPVLLYNGQFDLIVNTPGAQTWIYKMEWEGQEQFNNAAYVPWSLSGNIVGYTKSSGNLNFVMVNKAGHMVPYDQPLTSKIMFDNFVQKVMGNNQEIKEKTTDFESVVKIQKKAVR